MKCVFPFLWLTLIGALPAHAQEISQDEARVLPRLIASGCFDIVGDRNGCEQVMLLASEADPDSADLIILSDWRTDPPSDPLLIARGIAFNGSMWGMAPSIGRADNGSLLLHSEQSGIGRYPWFETLTIAYRGGAFVVAGFSYSTYDRPGGGGMSCDVNLITGEYSVEVSEIEPETEIERVLLDDSGRLSPLPVAAQDWALMRVFPGPCNAGVTALMAED